VKAPATMTASEINRELDKLDKRYSQLNDRFIAAGRGSETAFETWDLTDPLALEWQTVQNRRWMLRIEIGLRYGPETVSRLPARGFPPRHKASE